MASEVEICNRALQMLGAGHIVDLTDDSPEARACNLAYEPCRDALYRKHYWNFTKACAELAADATAPAWGRATAAQLPADFVRLYRPYPEDNSYASDWEIEGRKIYTNDTAPLYLRYISRVTDPNEMDPLFRELLSTVMAEAMCEELTQSNTKKAALVADRKDIMAEARRANALENPPMEALEDEWITCRA